VTAPTATRLAALLAEAKETPEGVQVRCEPSELRWLLEARAAAVNAVEDTAVFVMARTAHPFAHELSGRFGAQWAAALEKGAPRTLTPAEVQAEADALRKRTPCAGGCGMLIDPKPRGQLVYRWKCDRCDDGHPRTRAETDTKFNGRWLRDLDE
jgi:hypothetical protein